MEQNHLCLVRQISERAAGMVGSSLSAKKSVKELRRDATQRYIDMQCNVTSNPDANNTYFISTNDFRIHTFLSAHHKKRRPVAMHRHVRIFQ